jgi:DNA-binding transcriptional LysR family regulator
VQRDLDIDLLRTFVTIVDAGGFTKAGAKLGRTQSAVSLQVQRLEELAGKVLFAAAGRARVLTHDGEVLLAYARRILALNEEARARLAAPELHGRVRLGTPEDFATVHLPGVLARFAENYPRVALDVKCDFTVNLLAAFDKGAFDLVLVKREPVRAGRGMAEAGVEVWHEPLVWVAGAQMRAPPPPGEALTLALAPAPDVYRARALKALEAAGRGWRIAFTSPSLSGLHAAVRAGLGISVFSRDMVPKDLRILGEDAGLPPLEDSEMALLRHQRLSKAGQRLAEHIMQSFERG